MRWSSTKLFAVMAVLVVVSGCGPKGEQIMIQNAKDSNYSEGYGDGCASGRVSAGSREVSPAKDLHRYLSNTQYKEGWNTGFKECKFRELNVAKLSDKPVKY